MRPQPTIATLTGFTALLLEIEMAML